MSAKCCVLIAAVFTAVPLFAAGGQNVIAPGDTLKISVLGEPDHSKQVIVDDDGRISLPLVKDIQVAGLTTTAAAAAVADKLGKFIKNPDVTVELIQRARRQVTVAGPVKTPGVYPIERETRVMEVIGLAGGFLAGADRSKVTITRRGSAEPINCNLEAFLAGTQPDANVVLQDGDVIQVPESAPTLGTVFVYGAVRLPGQPVMLREGMKVSQAISAAGGIVPEQADLTRATVKRSGQNEPIQIDLAKSLAGDPAADITLQSGDVVTVPTIEQMGTFTIIGGVARSGDYPLKKDMTVSKAIAAAGGQTPRAKISEIRLTRMDNSGVSRSTRIDLSKISEGSEPDVALQPGDTIFVPEQAERQDSTRWLAIGISLLGILLRGR